LSLSATRWYPERAMADKPSTRALQGPATSPEASYEFPAYSSPGRDLCRRSGHPNGLPLPSGCRVAANASPPTTIVSPCRRASRELGGRCDPSGGSADWLAGVGPAAAGQVWRRLVGPSQADPDVAARRGRASEPAAPRWWRWLDLETRWRDLGNRGSGQMRVRGRAFPVRGRVWNQLRRQEYRVLR